MFIKWLKQKVNGMLSTYKTWSEEIKKTWEEKIKTRIILMYADEICDWLYLLMIMMIGTIDFDQVVGNT